MRIGPLPIFGKTRSFTVAASLNDGSRQAQGIPPGTVKLDADFTDKGFRAELHNHYSVVHLASHFDFIPGADRNSFLLLGDGSKLTLEEFRGMPRCCKEFNCLPFRPSQ